jgi:hypothetical protein
MRRGRPERDPKGVPVGEVLKGKDNKKWIVTRSFSGSKEWNPKFCGIKTWPLSSVRKAPFVKMLKVASKLDGGDLGVFFPWPGAHKQVLKTSHLDRIMKGKLGLWVIPPQEYGSVLWLDNTYRYLHNFAKDGKTVVTGTGNDPWYLVNDRTFLFVQKVLDKAKKPSKSKK